ncbi:MAG: hypothetical protein ACXVE0_17120 [Gaiellaceae bacterium]
MAHSQSTTDGRTEPASHTSEPERTVVLGIAVAPGLAHELTADLIADLQRALNERFGSVEWKTELTVDRLVSPSAPTTEILDAARRSLLEARWDLGIVITDLPLRVGRRPMTTQVSTTHRIAIVSLPAFGALNLRGKLRRTLIQLVDELLGGRSGDTAPGTARGRRREHGVLRELTTRAAERPGGIALLYVPAVVYGNFRLLIGMVHSNRPWRLAMSLYAALAAALAVGAYGLINFDVWRISIAMSPWRLTPTVVASIAITVVAIIAVHGLWERAPDQRVRDQVALFNLATAATVASGILSLYAVLFVTFLTSSAIITGPSLLASQLHRHVAAVTYCTHALFVASLATFAGALGASLESDEAVRAAAYASSRGGQPRRPGDGSR